MRVTRHTVNGNYNVRSPPVLFILKILSGSHDKKSSSRSVMLGQVFWTGSAYTNTNTAGYRWHQQSFYLVLCHFFKLFSLRCYFHGQKWICYADTGRAVKQGCRKCIFKLNLIQNYTNYTIFQDPSLHRSLYLFFFQIQYCVPYLCLEQIGHFTQIQY